MAFEDLKKVKDRAKKAREFAARQTEMAENERIKKKYEKEKAEYNESVKGKREKEIAKILQSYTRVVDNTCKYVFDEYKVLCARIFEFIKQELNIDDTVKRKYVYVEDIPFGELELIINQLLPVLKNIQEVTANPLIATKAANNSYTLYERFMNSLIDLDARFMLFAPKKSIERTATQKKISGLPQVQQIDIQQRINKLEMDENADYVREYMSCILDPRDFRVRFAIKTMEYCGQTERLAKTNIATASEAFATNIVEFVKKEFPQGSSDQEFVEIVRLCILSFRRIKTVSNNQDVAGIADWYEMNPFEELFSKLIDHDARFAVYAPKKALQRLDIDFKNLSEENKNIVFAQIQKYGLWNNPDYQYVYKDMFASQIGGDPITV